MAYTTIDDPSVYFQSTLYSGDSNNSTVITNTGNSNLQPDFIWIKSRTHGNAGTGGHMWFDSTRGIKSTTGSDSPFLVSNSTSGDQTNANGLQAIGTNSFTPGSMTRTNETGDNYVAWQWKCNGGTTSSNSSGSITSTVQVNQDAGFSIITYTGNSNNPSSIGHGLGVKPEFYVIKQRNSANSWKVYHAGVATDAEDYVMELNTTGAREDNAIWNDTGPTSSVINFTDHGAVNQSGDTYIAYCFASKQGYSKFGSYVGNGSNDGSFIWTGFAPAFVMTKKSSDSGGGWFMQDIKRGIKNQDTDTPVLQANDAYSEADIGTTDYEIDFLSNGFKLRDDNTYVNLSGTTYIYMAFANNPFVSSSGVPCTAR